MTSQKLKIPGATSAMRKLYEVPDVAEAMKAPYLLGDNVRPFAGPNGRWLAAEITGKRDGYPVLPANI